MGRAPVPSGCASGSFRRPAARLHSLGILLSLIFLSPLSALAEDLDLLFLGDNGHHRPADRFHQLAPVLDERAIHLKYTDDVASLNTETLNRFDGLIVYANIDRIELDQAQALLEFVDSGKGFIPLHCATYCFRNNPDVVALMGGQFKRHGAGVFATQVVSTDHPLVRGYGGFTSWDESYIHTLHNEQNRTVLEYRSEGPQAEGREREPWTWVRTHGKGRVFYTAWGHDHRTWSHPGFHNLVERGIRWATGDDPLLAGEWRNPDRFDTPDMAEPRTDVKPVEYVDVGPKIPNYTPSQKWGTQGDPHTKMQKPLPASESLKHFVAPVGFEVRLFASEPELGGKPIAMNWDERGRLWVCETYDYPNELQPPGKGRDRIRICEDTDGDFTADRFTVFAEQLSIPTAILPFRGGAIVQNGTETLFLKDTDGDDKADVKEVLISNWTLGDTHGGVSNFQYGLDNWIWAMQGYNNSTPVINGVEQQTFRMGFFRFRLSNTDPPRVEELEFIRSTNNNTWGLGISEDGLIFGSTANRHPSMYMPIANRYYERVRGWSPSQLTTIADTFRFDPITDKVRQVDQHGGYTAGAGHALYTARVYPKPWWNRTAFVCGPTGHLVGTFVLRPYGADFTSTSPCNLLASDDEWSAPIMAEVGPDGNVWVIDWYNYIVQHNPTPHGFETGKGNAYKSDLRDKHHGRIYRVVYVGDDGGAAVPMPSLANASPVELVKALTHPTMLWRKQAQRLLVERGKTDVVPALLELVSDRSVDDAGLNVGAIHALHTLKGLGVLNDAGSRAFTITMNALKHPSAGVQRNALSVLPRVGESLPGFLRLAADPEAADPQVRIAALLALSDDLQIEDAAQEQRSVIGWLLSSIPREPFFGDDRWLADALTSAAAVHADSFLMTLGSRDSHGVPLSSREVGDPEPLSQSALAVARIVAEHMARERVELSTLNLLLTELADDEPRLLAAVFDGISAGWPRDHSVRLSEEAEAALVGMLQRVPTATKSQIVRLGETWGSEELAKHVQAVVDSLLKDLGDPKSAVEQRVDAAQQLVRFRPSDDEVVSRLLGAISPQTPPELSDGIIRALGGSTANGLGQRLMAAASSATPTVRDASLRVLLSRAETTSALLDGVENGQLPLDDLNLEQKQSLNNHPDKAVRERARRLLKAGGGLPNPDRERVIAERLALTERQGDVKLGKAVFRKQCAKCHRHSGEGENIGPDLTGMAVHPKKELLIHILDPGRSVEGNFRLYTVVTEDGRVLSGMLASETRTSVEVIDTEAKRHPIQRSDIEELISSRKSVMPEGFEKQINNDDLVHLLEFLTDKGPYLPLDFRRVATVSSARGMFYNEQNLGETMIFPNWKPKTVDGVPFVLTDPRAGRVPNIIMLNSPNGSVPPRMPQDVSLLVNSPARAIHMLSGISGWGHPLGEKGSLSVTLRVHYSDGETEDHQLKNGIHFADYIRRIDVPESKFAFDLRGRQVRYLVVRPQRADPIKHIQLIKGPDRTAPMVMAITIETGR